MTITRRRMLQMTGGAVLSARAAFAAAFPAPRSVSTPGPVAQIACTSAGTLVGVTATGTLCELAIDGGAAIPLADGIDADTPLATGHDRIAARRRDGALIVTQRRRITMSAPAVLARQAGMLNLPFAVIAIGADAPHRAVRLEQRADGRWAVADRSAVSTLPDAHPVLADLDGSGDGGHVVLLGGPDDTRYRHGILGDVIEATRLHVVDRHSLRAMRTLEIAAPYVIEDLAPRVVALDGRDGLLTIQSGPTGSRLLLVDIDPDRRDALRVAARGDALGTAHRWLAPTTDGTHWLAVHTPHIGGILYEYRRAGDALEARRIRANVTNHRIGTRVLDIAAWQAARVAMPDQARRRLVVLDATANFAAIGERELESPVIATTAIAGASLIGVLQENGAVVVADVAG